MAGAQHDRHLGRAVGCGLGAIARPQRVARVQVGIESRQARRSLDRLDQCLRMHAPARLYFFAGAIYAAEQRTRAVAAMSQPGAQAADRIRVGFLSSENSDYAAVSELVRLRAANLDQQPLRHKFHVREVERRQLGAAKGPRKTEDRIALSRASRRCCGSSARLMRKI